MTERWSNYEDEDNSTYTDERSSDIKTSSNNTDATNEPDYPIVFVTGPPGSGRSELCKALKKRYGFIHMTRPDEAVGLSDYAKVGRVMEHCFHRVNHPGRKFKRYTRKTGLTKPKFLIEGFPESREQWELFVEKCETRKAPECSTFMIILECDMESAKERLEGKDVDVEEAYDKWYDNLQGLQHAVKTAKTAIPDGHGWNYYMSFARKGREEWIIPPEEKENNATVDDEGSGAMETFSDADEEGRSEDMTGENTSEGDTSDKDMPAEDVSKEDMSEEDMFREDMSEENVDKYIIHQVLDELMHESIWNQSFSPGSAR